MPLFREDPQRFDAPGPRLDVVRTSVLDLEQMMFGIFARRGDRLGYVGGGGFGNDAQARTRDGMRRIEYALCLQ